jgi:hypothetical protein
MEILTIMLIAAPVIVLIIRAYLLGLKLRNYVLANHEDKAPEFGISHYLPYFWADDPSKFNRRTRQLLRNDDIGDPELIRLAERAKRAGRVAYIAIFLAALVGLLIVLCFRK